MEQQGAEFFIQSVLDAGPTVTALALGIYLVLKKLDTVDSKFDKLDLKIEAVERRMNDKLNNGIKDELTSIKTQVAVIEGEMKSIPKRASDV